MNVFTCFTDQVILTCSLHLDKDRSLSSAVTRTVFTAVTAPLLTSVHSTLRHWWPRPLQSTVSRPRGHVVTYMVSTVTVIMMHWYCPPHNNHNIKITLVTPWLIRVVCLAHYMVICALLLVTCSKIFSCESSSRNANVRLSVCLSSKVFELINQANKHQTW